MEAVMRMKFMATAIALLALTTPVAAQQAETPNGWMMGPGYNMGYGMGTGGMPMMGMMMGGQHVEGRLAFLKTELKITPAQEGVWDGYAKALRANAELTTTMMKDMRRGMGGGWPVNQNMMGQGMMGQGVTGGGMMGDAQAKPLTVPERLDWMEQHMTRHMEMLAAMKGPTEALYQALDATQKQLADQLLAGPMGMM
jgi:hypothetical protein